MAKAAVAVGLMALSAVAQVYSQQQTASRNAKISQRNSDMALAAAKLQADQVREDGARRLSAIAADAGASGFTPDGSVLDTLFEQARQTEREVQIAMYNGQVSSTAHLTQAQTVKQDATSASINTLFGTAARIGSVVPSSKGIY